MQNSMFSTSDHQDINQAQLYVTVWEGQAYIEISKYVVKVTAQKKTLQKLDTHELLRGHAKQHDNKKVKT